MSVRLTSQESRIALFDSVTGFAFGPTFHSDEDAESFVAFVRDIANQDPRAVSQARLSVYFDRWLEIHKRSCHDGTWPMADPMPLPTLRES